MSEEFKVLILPGDLNDTPNEEDLYLVITKEEFIRMWRRGEVMLRNRRLKGKQIDEDFRASIEIC
jgi:hypothetical protein